MYDVRPATKEIKGWVDLSIETKRQNAVELAAAWGLMSKPKAGETYAIHEGTVTFRIRQSTYDEWLDIVNSVTEEK